MDYPYVIRMNGKLETLFSPRDFERLLDESMGYDAAYFFRRLIEELTEENEALEHELDDALAEIDELREAARG